MLTIERQEQLGTRRNKLVAFMAVWLIGCATAEVSVTMLNQGIPRSYSPTIDLYTAPDGVKVPYDEIAIIVSDSQGWHLTEAQLTDELVKKARSMGANGIILQATSSQHETTYMQSGKSFVPIDLKYTTVRGIAIVYKQLPTNRGHEKLISKEAVKAIQPWTDKESPREIDAAKPIDDEQSTPETRKRLEK